MGLLGQAIGGRAAYGIVNVHEAYVFILPRGGYLVGIGFDVPAFHWKLHIALTRAQPHLAYHHIAQRYRLAIG